MYGVLIFVFGCEVFRCVSVSELFILIAWLFSLHGVVAILLDQHSSRCNCDCEEMFARVLFLFFVLLDVEVAASVEEVVVKFATRPEFHNVICRPGGRHASFFAVIETGSR